MSELFGGTGGPDSQMDAAQARSALEGAGAQEAADDAATAAEFQTPAPAPDQQAAEPGLGTTAPAQADEFTTPDTEQDPDLWDGEPVNPDLLPDDLKPLAKQLEAAFTRKTQAVAEQRKALEALGSPEELQTASEFYNSLKDPEYLKNFYNELGDVVQELGLVEAPAAPADAEPVAPEIPAELAQIAQSDPELSPLVQEFTQMRTEFQQFMEQTAQERQAMAEERELMSQAAEIDRMVQVVREQNPDYGEDDWTAIYDRSIALDGDVLKAAELYKADADRILQTYLSRKPVPNSVEPVPGGGTVTESDDPDAKPRTMDDAQREAEAWLNANDQQEFAG